MKKYFILYILFIAGAVLAKTNGYELPDDAKNSFLTALPYIITGIVSTIVSWVGWLFTKKKNK